MASTLGECDKQGCHGDLCLRGSLVTCDLCGAEFPQHPMSLEIAEEVAAEKTAAAKRQPFEAQKVDYAASLPERLLALEKLVAVQVNLVTVHGERIKHLEAALKVKAR